MPSTSQNGVTSNFSTLSISDRWKIPECSMVVIWPSNFYMERTPLLELNRHFITGTLFPFKEVWITIHFDRKPIYFILLKSYAYYNGSVAWLRIKEYQPSFKIFIHVFLFYKTKKPRITTKICNYVLNLLELKSSQCVYICMCTCVCTWFYDLNC